VFVDSCGRFEVQTAYSGFLNRRIRNPLTRFFLNPRPSFSLFLSSATSFFFPKSHGLSVSAAGSRGGGGVEHASAAGRRGTSSVVVARAVAGRRAFGAAFTSGDGERTSARRSRELAPPVPPVLRTSSTPAFPLARAEGSRELKSCALFVDWSSPICNRLAADLGFFFVSLLLFVCR
jgi:hypothetical protein